MTRRRIMMTIAVCAAVTLLPACDNSQNPEPNDGITTEPSQPTQEVALGSGEPAISRISRPDGLIIEELRLGDGEPCLPGAWITVHYRGWLLNGPMIRNTYDREPDFIESRRLILGFRDGVVGMRVGGKRRLIIPPELGFEGFVQRDAEGRITIPPNSTLVYEVELLGVEYRSRQAPSSATR